MSLQRTFQPPTTRDIQFRKQRLEDAFACLIQNCNEGDFTRLYNALERMKRIDTQLYQALRSTGLLCAIFDMVWEENDYRCSRPVDDRGAV